MSYFSSVFFLFRGIRYMGFPWINRSQNLGTYSTTMDIDDALLVTQLMLRDILDRAEEDENFQLGDDANDGQIALIDFVSSVRIFQDDLRSRLTEVST